MPKLPAVSGRDVIRVLRRLGFEDVGQRGSHVKLRRGSTTCIVPLHRELKKGTLTGVLAMAEIGIDEFVEVLTR